MIDTSTLTFDEANALKTQAVLQIATDYANASASFSQYAPLWSDGYTPAIAQILQVMPSLLDGACASVGLGSYLIATGQAVAPVSPMPTVNAQSLGLIPPQ